jgi:very-short-patch-repair endonuclease
VTIDCGHCGGSFRIVPSNLGRSQYCSIRCYRAGGAETNIERRVRETLEDLRVPHRPQEQIGSWVVDFLAWNWLVIEADGGYWHSLRPHVDKTKTAEIEDLGYTVWRLPEAEIVKADFPGDLKKRLATYSQTAIQVPLHLSLPRQNK